MGPDLTTNTAASTQPGPASELAGRLPAGGWAAVEAVVRQRGATPIQVQHHRVADRGGRSIGKVVAAARKLLTLVYYGLRDGEIRCLAEAG